MSRPSYQQYLRVSRSSEVFMAVGQHQAGTGELRNTKRNTHVDNVTTGICFIDPTVSLSTTLWHFLKNVKGAGVFRSQKKLLLQTELQIRRCPNAVPTTAVI